MKGSRTPLAIALAVAVAAAVAAAVVVGAAAVAVAAAVAPVAAERALGWADDLGGRVELGGAGRGPRVEQDGGEDLGAGGVAGEQTVTSAEIYCRTSRASFLARKELPFLMFERESGALVGAAGLHRTVWATPRTEIERSVYAKLTWRF